MFEKCLINTLSVALICLNITLKDPKLFFHMEYISKLFQITKGNMKIE